MTEEINETQGYTRDSLIQLLNNDIKRFVFTTKKGAECIKYATLRDNILPPRPVVEEGVDANDELKKKRKVNPDVCNFWSVEDSGWRATRIENIISVEDLNEQELIQFGHLLVDTVKQAPDAQTG